jgi:hypothetical protein
MFEDVVVDLSNIIVRLNISLNLGKIYELIPENFPCFCVKYNSAIRLCAFREEYPTKNIKSSFNTSLGVNRYVVSFKSAWIKRKYQERYPQSKSLLGKFYHNLQTEEYVEFRPTFKFTNPNVIQISGMKLYEKTIIKVMVKRFLRDLQTLTHKKIRHFQNEEITAKGENFIFPILPLKEVDIDRGYTCLVKSKIELINSETHFIDLMELINMIEKHGGGIFVASPNQEKDYSKVIIDFQDKTGITGKEWVILEGEPKEEEDGEEETKRRSTILRHRKNPSCVKMSAFCKLIHINAKSIYRNLRAVKEISKFIRKYHSDIIKKK